MKDELQLKLVEILTAIQDTAGKAGDFAMEQLPDIAQSYVAYGRAITVYKTVVLLLVAVCLGLVSRWAYLNPWNTSTYSFERENKRSDSNYLVMFVPGVVGAVLAFVGLVSFNWLVWFAPKVWLLKEIAGLLK